LRFGLLSARLFGLLSISANCNACGPIVERTRGRYISRHSFTQSACGRLSGEAVLQRSLRYDGKKRPLRAALKTTLCEYWGRPAFPYPAYTKVTDRDVLAMRAYLNTIAPVRFTPPANALNFPFNQRWLMLSPRNFRICARSRCICVHCRLCAAT
jgi:hypothetical protein